MRGDDNREICERFVASIAPSFDERSQKYYWPAIWLVYCVPDPEPARPISVGPFRRLPVRCDFYTWNKEGTIEVLPDLKTRGDLRRYLRERGVEVLNIQRPERNDPAEDLARSSAGIAEKLAGDLTAAGFLSSAGVVQAIAGVLGELAGELRARKASVR